MERFIGEYSAKVDDKGRVVFPAAFKSCVPEGEDMKFIIRKENFSPCLEIYTAHEWERHMEEVRSKINPAFNPRHADLWRSYLLNCFSIEPDARLGRLNIPNKLWEMIGVNPQAREVIFYGGGHKIEIWAKDKFESSLMSNEEFISMLSDLA